MYVSTEQILRLIRDHGTLSDEEIVRRFPDANPDHLQDHLSSLVLDKLISYNSIDFESPGKIYRLLPAGVDHLASLDHKASLEREHTRRLEEISDKLKELEELRDMAELQKTQTHIAIKKATQADWLSIFSFLIAAGTFLVYLFEVFGK